MKFDFARLYAKTATTEIKGAFNLSSQGDQGASPFVNGRRWLSTVPLQASGKVICSRTKRSRIEISVAAFPLCHADPRHAALPRQVRTPRAG